jgi:hypothetical protein
MLSSDYTSEIFINLGVMTPQNLKHIQFVSCNHKEGKSDT